MAQLATSKFHTSKGPAGVAILSLGLIIFIACICAVCGICLKNRILLGFPRPRGEAGESLLRTSIPTALGSYGNAGKRERGLGGRVCRPAMLMGHQGGVPSEREMSFLQPGGRRQGGQTGTCPGSGVSPAIRG
ncbi:unnamed protein product [Protopolystoma xenopodis]|uniref:Uncharacterized protein n=1 Tax=Protopolystoma xenopodis TaxID=117903 RepID=A0A3S5BM88_9PLAT|nr:unnamed protein product [Protopolystoma xenopodis]